jgi:hypothetical protein
MSAPAFLTTLLIFLLFSCTNKDDLNKTVTAKKIAGIYKVTVMVYQVGTAAPVDGIATAPVCERDDFIQMNENFTFNYLDAGVQCNPPRIGSGSWGLPSTSVITISAENYDIVSFSGHTLILKQNTVTSSGETYKLNMTMVKQ